MASVELYQEVDTEVTINPTKINCHVHLTDFEVG
jgi:hypothetical protein